MCEEERYGLVLEGCHLCLDGEGLRRKRKGEGVAATAEVVESRVVAGEKAAATGSVGDRLSRGDRLSLRSRILLY